MAIKAIEKNVPVKLITYLLKHYLESLMAAMLMQVVKADWG